MQRPVTSVADPVVVPLGIYNPLPVIASPHPLPLIIYGELPVVKKVVVYFIVRWAVCVVAAEISSTLDLSPY